MTMIAERKWMAGPEGMDRDRVRRVPETVGISGVTGVALEED